MHPETEVEAIGPFATYTEAERAAEEMSVRERDRRVRIRPVGLRMTRDGVRRAANETLLYWIVFGALVGGVLGSSAGLVNAGSSMIDRPWGFFATLLVVGLTIGAMGGVIGGVIAARRVSRDAAGEPRFRAARYEVVAHPGRRS